MLMPQASHEAQAHLRFAFPQWRYRQTKQVCQTHCASGNSLLWRFFFGFFWVSEWEGTNPFPPCTLRSSNDFPQPEADLLSTFGKQKMMQAKLFFLPQNYFMKSLRWGSLRWGSLRWLSQTLSMPYLESSLAIPNTLYARDPSKTGQ